MTLFRFPSEQNDWNSVGFNGRLRRVQLVSQSGGLSALSVCRGVCVCVRRSEAGVSGEKGQVSSAADECRSYISSRPPQTPEQWVSTSQHLHIAPSMSSPAAISLLKIGKLLKLFFCPFNKELVTVLNIKFTLKNIQMWKSWSYISALCSFYPYVNTQIRPPFTPSLHLQWWTDPRCSAGQEGFLEEDVQVAERRQWHQQPIGTGHLRVHHRPLWHHHWPALPLQVPSHFTSQEAEAADRWERLLCNKSTSHQPGNILTFNCSFLEAELKKTSGNFGLQCCWTNKTSDCHCGCHQSSTVTDK